MKQTINFTGFCDAFRSMNRDNNFSYEGKRALFDYLEEYEEIELDVIAFCCEYTESTIEEALAAYGYENIEELNNNTVVIQVNDNTIIYANF